MKQKLFFLLTAVICCMTSSCDDWDPDPDPPLITCEYDSQETISFINFGLKVPEYTGQSFDMAFGINYASSDRTIFFLTQALETKGNQGPENVAIAEIRFLTDGKNCADKGVFNFEAGDPEVGATSIVAPAPSTPWTGDVKISIRTDAFYNEHDNAAITVNWVKQENNPDNIIEGNLNGDKMLFRPDASAIIVPTPIYGGGTLN